MAKLLCEGYSSPVSAVIYLVTLRYVLAFVLWTISLFVAVFVYTGWMPTTKDNYFEKTAVAAALILFCQTIGAFLLCSLRWKKATRFSLDLGTSAMTYVPRPLCIVCVCELVFPWGIGESSLEVILRFAMVYPLTRMDYKFKF